MAESIGAVRVDIVGNAEDLKVEVQRAKTLVASMGPEFEKSYAKMNESQKRATLATLKFEQTIGKTKDEIKLLSLAARGAAPEALEKLRLSMLRTRDAAGSTNTLLGAQSKAFAGSNKTARELQFAMRGLPAQITDIGVSLASGQRPMMVFLQQGGQLKDLFGGIRPAAAALSQSLMGLINPFTLAAAGIATIGLAWKQAADEAIAFNRALISTGNYAGTSATEMQQLAAELDSVSGVTQKSASAAIAAVAETGRFTRDQFDTVARAVVEWSAATGQSVDEVIQQFVRLADDPLKAIESLDKSQHFLTDSTRKQIKSLVEQGKEVDAARLAIETYADALGDRAPRIEENLGYIEQGWRAVKTAASEAWDAMLQGGRDDTLAQLDAKIARYQSALAGNLPVGTRERYQQQLEALRAQAAPLRAGLASSGVSAAFAFLDAPRPDEPEEDESGRGSGGRSVRSRTLSDQARAAREAERALAALMREEDRLYAASLKGEDAKSRAMESWAELVAQLEGPVALAQFRHKQELLDIAEAGKAAGASADEIAAAQRRATEAYEQTTPAALAAAEAQKRAIEEAARISRSLQFATEDMFASFIDGSESASEAIENFGKAVLRIAARVLAERAVTALFNLFNPGYNFNPANYSDRGGLAGMGNFDLPVRNAKGGVYASRDLSKFSGKVYDSPQLFKFARGAGIFGEAGPEAIMPLKRGADGKLGVQANGAAGPQQINIRIVGAPSQPEARAVPNESGGFDLELVFKQLEGRMASSTMRRGSPMNQAVQTVQRSARGVPVSS